jgi:aspartyl-tRNA(Asn)/glutamyl-tRNA(Gln) amidotransferase subunit C
LYAVYLRRRAMKLRAREIEHLAALARLRLGAEEAGSITRDLGRVLEYMSVLDEIETAGADPIARGREAAPALRSDDPAAGLGDEEALRAAPRRYRGHFLMPKAI